MRLLIISLYSPEDLTHGVGLILNNTLRSLEINGVSDLGLVVSSDSVINSSSCEKLYVLNTVRKGSFRSRVIKSFFSTIDSEDRVFLEKLAVISKNYDGAIFFGTPWDPLAFFLPSWINCPVWFHVTDSIFNTEMQRNGNRTILWIRQKLAKSLESRVLNSNYSGFIYVGLTDAIIAKLLITHHQRIHCICNGINSDKFIPSKEYPKDSYLKLLFVGVLSFAPNVDAMIEFMERIAPAITVNWKLRVVGRNPPPVLFELAKKWPQVTIVGSVPDVVEEYQKAHLFICPTRMNAGVKNKLLEAISCGIPTLANKAAAENLDFIPDGITVADNILDFSNKINKANEHLMRWRTDALKGREQLRKSLSWEARTAQIINLIRPCK